MDSLVMASAFALLAILIVSMGSKVVPQGYEYTVERFGCYTHTLRPGLHLIIPLVDRIGAKLNMMENVFEVPSQDVITRDNAGITVDGVVFYQVLEAAKIEIKDTTSPRDLVDAMGQQMKAERLKRATILEAEGERQSAVLMAEGKKQSVILAAEAQREAAYREAEARERRAEAKAKATLMVSKAIADGNIQTINYFVAQNYVGALEKIASADNQKIIMMLLEASHLIGSLGGISEIIKESFESKQAIKTKTQKHRETINA